MLLSYRESGQPAGQLRLSPGCWRGHPEARPATISVLTVASDERRAVEAFIERIYAESYGARIRVDYPVLMSVRNEAGEILAALGFRHAGAEPLFLEQYLRAPVETLIGVPRDGIVEIGNLASAGGGASLFLFAALAAYLHHRGAAVALATGTETVEKRLRQFGLALRRLGAADPARLQNASLDWGRYYDAQPNVLAGRVAEGYSRLQAQLGVEYSCVRPRLLPRLHYRPDLQ